MVFIPVVSCCDCFRFSSYALISRVLCDNVSINDGLVLMDGTPDEVFANREILKNVGLEVPQCTALIHELRALGIKLEGEKISNPQDCADLIVDALKKGNGQYEED